jgi:hypothetical protein
VLSEAGTIRYASMSPTLRETGFWIEIGVPVSKHSVMGKVLLDKSMSHFDEIPAYHWTNKDRFIECQVSEEVVLLTNWNQALGLLWFEEEEKRSQGRSFRTSDEDDELLPELDGILPWPSKRRRR